MKLHYFLMVLFAIYLGCTSKDIQHDTHSGDTVIFSPSDISGIDHIEDSISIYKDKIDTLFTLTIGRLSLSSDSISAKFLNLVSKYQDDYLKAINLEEEMMYEFSGLNDNNFSNSRVMKFYGLVIEYQKLKELLTQLCGNYFETGEIEIDSIDQVPSCLFDFDLP